MAQQGGTAHTPAGMNIEALFSYKAHMLGMLPDRRLSTTKKGYLGLGPASMLVRDLICVLKGAEVPFVLRETGEVVRRSKSLWKKEQLLCILVGECYVHGIMDGQFWRGIFSAKDFVVS